MAQREPKKSIEERLKDWETKLMQDMNAPRQRTRLEKLHLIGSWLFILCMSIYVGVSQYMRDKPLPACRNVERTHRLDPSSYVRADDELAWRDPELPVWLRLQSYVVTGMPYAFLDVGCGASLAVVKFGPLFHEVTCLEPDAEKLRGAREHWALEHPSSTTTANWLDFGLLDHDNTTTYDVVTCINQVEYLPMETFAEWMTRLYDVLRSGGVLVLVTTVAEETKYTVGNATVDVSEFEESPGLGTRWWSKEDLAALVTASGLSVMEQEAYAFRPDGGAAVSQFLVARKIVDNGEERDLPGADPGTCFQLDDVHLTQRETEQLSLPLCSCYD